jgi:hypothetical protein
MERLSLVLIAVGLILWVRKHVESENGQAPLANNREKIQNIDARLYR